MAKYAFPAVFTKEEGAYSVSFPDIEGCYTFGKNEAEAIEMAEDALCLMLYSFEEDKQPIPHSSNVKEIQTDTDSFVTLISCDTTTKNGKIVARVVNQNVSSVDSISGILKGKISETTDRHSLRDERHSRCKNYE